MGLQNFTTLTLDLNEGIEKICPFESQFKIDCLLWKSLSEVKSQFANRPDVYSKRSSVKLRKVLLVFSVDFFQSIS